MQLEGDVYICLRNLLYCIAEVKVQCTILVSWQQHESPCILSWVIWPCRTSPTSALEEQEVCWQLLATTISHCSVQFSGAGRRRARDKDWIMHDCFIWAACAWLHVIQVGEDVQGHAAVLCLTTAELYSCCCSNSMFTGEWAVEWGVDAGVDLYLYRNKSPQHSY